MMAPALIGRDSALEAIDRVLGELETRQSGRVLRIAGEPGIGKTRLLAELATRGEERAFMIFEGRAAEFEQDLPFAIFVDALDDRLAALGARKREQFDPGLASHLAAVFPAFASMGGERSFALLDERYRVHRAVRLLLERLARRAPVVLALDDLHWVDAASGELLRHLLAHPPCAPVLIAVAYRPAQLGGRIRAALERGQIDRRIESVDVGALSRAHARLLLGADLSGEIFDAIYSESGGNPFYMLELARGLTRGGRVSGKAEPAGEVPQGVIAAIQEEVAALTEDARELLQGAAVAGEPFSPDTAAAAAGIFAADALRLLDRLVEAGLIRQAAVPRAFEFRHPLVRRAVYESAQPGWRIAAHRRLAEDLRRRGAPAVELARHVEAVAQPGDEEAIALLTAAGHATVYHAPGIAARHFEAALDLLAGVDHHADSRLELLTPLATSLGAAGRLRESRRTLLEALNLLPAEAAAPRARLEAFCAAVENLLGLHAEAQQRLHAALKALPEGRSPEAASLMVELAANAVWGMQWSAMRAWAAEALNVSRETAQASLEVSALALLALGEYCLGRPARGAEPVRLAARLLDAMNDADVGTHLHGPYYLAWAEFWLERFEEAVRHADRGLALARTTGHGQFFAPTLTAKACALRRLGHLRQAGETVQEAVESARLAGHDQMIAWALAIRVWIATAEGDLALALSSGEEALTSFKRLVPSMIRAAIGWQYGEALLEAGEPLRCSTLVLDAMGGPEAEIPTPAERCYGWHLLARADAARGRHRSAQTWIERLDATTSNLPGSNLPCFLAESARAHVLLARAEPAHAAHAALVAVEAAERVHARLDAARARLLAGRALAAAGERARGIDLLERARAELDLHGAVRYREEAIRALRRLGIRVGRGGRRALARAGTESLSERELAIAQLAAAGWTNKEIGAELFISTKTVERHLSHVFRKLDVSSRAQVGALLTRSHGR